MRITRAAVASSPDPRDDSPHDRALDRSRRHRHRLRLLGGIEGVRRILRRRGAFLESVESDRDATTKYRFLAQGARDGRWIHKLSSGGWVRRGDIKVDMWMPGNECRPVLIVTY